VELALTGGKGYSGKDSKHGLRRGGSAEAVIELKMTHTQTINLAQAAVQQFGAIVFWSFPGFTVTSLDEARLAAAMLRKYGGRKGWQKAQEIQDAIDGVSKTGP